MRVFCNIISVVFALVLLTGTVCSRAEEPKREIDSVDIIEKFAAAREGVGVLSLPVTIHNKRYLFILDTGSAGMLYDTSFRPILGKPKKPEKGRTGADDIELATFDSPEAFLGNISLKTASNVVVADLSNLRELTGNAYYGIIGMSFLRNHIIRIDFDKGEVCFLKALRCKPGPSFPLSFQHGVIHTEAIIPGCDRKEGFDIATGFDTNDSGTISLDYYNYLVGRHIARPLTSGQKGLTISGNTVKDADFRLNAFSLDPFTHRNLIFSTSPRRDNTLGLGYLSRYIVTFDFPNRAMYLEKGKMYELPDGYDRSGISISRLAGKTVVRRVSWLSPAWRGGVKPQDVILKIEGYNANQISLYSLRRLLSIGGKKVQLLLERGQDRLEVSLMLSSNDERKGEVRE